MIGAFDFRYFSPHPPTLHDASALDQVAPGEMPAADPEAFQGIDKHLERQQVADSAMPAETVSSQMEAI